MKEPNLFFENTRSRLDLQVVHLINDEALNTLLTGENKKRNLYMLTDYIRKEHLNRFQEELKISRASLSCEILIHYKVYLLCKKWQKKMDNKLIRKAIRSTEVIDCGDKACDTNRFIWDFLCHFIKQPKNY